MNQLNKILEDRYGYLIFYKVKVEDDAAVYAARIETLLGKDEKFIMAIVPFHMAIKPVVKFNELHWVSFQTRSLPTTYNIPKQSCLVNSLGIEDIKLRVKQRNANLTQYYTPFPVLVELLHDPRRKTVYQYNDIITLRYALDTWNCMVNKME